MKVAFVNQPFDVIVPPFQNSIGYCTYGICRCLANSFQVNVFGLQDVHTATAAADCETRLNLRLIHAARQDLLFFKLRTKLGTLIQLSSPVSTSDRLFPNYGLQVANLLRPHIFDVIHLQHCSQYASIIRALNPRSKIVLQLHAEWFSQSNFEILKNRLEHVDLLLTVSDYITRKTKKDFPSISNRCETLYNGIDATEFQRRKDYAIHRQRKIKRILFSGAVSPHKGIHVLLDAFHIVVEEYNQVHLEIIGSMCSYPMEETFDLRDRETIDQVAPLYKKHPATRIQQKVGRSTSETGTYQDLLKRKVTSKIADKVTFSGFVGRQYLVEQYYDADIFVFPPIWQEGFGIPPIEAMAAGTPVIGTHSGALPETILDGETGYIVERNNPEALAERILRLLSDSNLREQMGEAGRQRVFDHFTWTRIANLMANRYQTLCGGSASEPGPFHPLFKGTS